MVARGCRWNSRKYGSPYRAQRSAFASRVTRCANGRSKDWYRRDRMSVLSTSCGRRCRRRCGSSRDRWGHKYMASKWRPGVVGRAAGRRRSARRSTPRPITFERLLDVRSVDRLLERLLCRPRRLMVVVVLIGLLLIGLDLERLLWASPASRAPATAPALVANSVAATAPPPGVSVEQEVLAVVASSNQASITAAVLGKVEPMAPYLAPEGSAWAAVQAEYRRRASRGETHDPALTRWGVL